MNIYTGQKSASQDLGSAREKGLAALIKARKTNSQKVIPVKLTTFEAKSKN